MQLRRFALLALALGTASLAQAADLPARTPPMPVFQAVEQLPNWTGMYVGLTGGGAFASRGHARLAYQDGAPFPAGLSSRSKLSGTVGGTLGYNQQIGSFVLGVEGDYSYLGLTSRSRVAFSQGLGALPASYGVNGAIRSRIESFGTVRGRIGYLVTPSLLVYGTGGLAFADVHSRAVLAEGITYGNSYAGLAYAGRNSGFKTGVAYGGGAEYKISPAWSAKVEALRVQLPDSRLYAGNDTPYGFAARRIRNDFTVVRAGVNYSFLTF